MCTVSMGAVVAAPIKWLRRRCVRVSCRSFVCMWTLLSRARLPSLAVQCGRIAVRMTSWSVSTTRASFHSRDCRPLSRTDSQDRPSAADHLHALPRLGRQVDRRRQDVPGVPRPGRPHRAQGARQRARCVEEWLRWEDRWRC